jgi:hypothetical protein
VHIWRRSYDVPPPALTKDDKRHPMHDPRYKDLPETDLPCTESLKDTVTRFMPYWTQALAPSLRAKERLIVAAPATHCGRWSSTWRLFLMLRFPSWTSQPEFRSCTSSTSSSSLRHATILNIPRLPWRLKRRSITLCASRQRAPER